jgi:signal transduction histidine kinase
VSGAAVVVGTAIVIPATSFWATTYSGASALAALADLLAGGGLIAAGSVLLVVDRRPDVGGLAVLAGVSWLASDWVGWQEGPPLARTIAMLLAPLYPALVLDLFVRSLPTAGRSTIVRRGVGLAYGCLGAIAVIAVLFRDPALDLRCWANCADDVLLVADVPAVAMLVAVAAPLAAGVTGLTMVAIAATRIARATRAERRFVVPVGLPTALVGGSLLAQAVAVMVGSPEGPQEPLFASLFQIRAWTAVALALGLIWTVVETRQRQTAVARLARELGDAPSPGAFAAALATAVHDPTLTVGYAVSPEAFVGADGRPLSMPAADGRHGLTPIVRRRRLVAVVSHDPAIADPDRLQQMIGGAGKLAMENERLLAVLHARLEEVRASRARLVATADAERRRLERDLHDGAQQRFLAVLHQLHVARGLSSEGHDQAAALDSLIEETNALIQELREVAHDIYPATLREAGLSGALRALADVADVPVELVGVPNRRFPPTVEQAAYAIVAEAIDGATSADAEFLGVRIADEGGLLAIDLDGLSPERLAAIEDRAAVASGTATIDGPTIRVGIPCASS